MTQPPEDPATQPSDPGLSPPHPTPNPPGRPSADPYPTGADSEVSLSRAFQSPYGPSYDRVGRPAPVAAAAPPREYPRARQFAFGAIGAAAVAMVAAAMPWYSLGGLSVTGLDEGADGNVTMPMALITLVVAVVAVVVRKRGILLGSGITSLAGGALVVLVSVVDIIDVTSTEVFGVTASLGGGLIVTAVAGAALAVVGLLQILACGNK